MSNPAAGDSRRSCALVVHYSTRNIEGCNAVLREAKDVDRVGELILALCNLFQHIVPILITPLGIVCMSELVIDMANTKDGDPHIRRAAQLIAHHGNSNDDGIEAVLLQAGRSDTVTELVLAILNLYETVLPALYAPTGLRALQRTIINYAAEENQEEDDQEGDDQ